MVRFFILLAFALAYCQSVWAQYADTLKVTTIDSIDANTPEALALFGYLSNHVDPQIIYAQYFWATNRFDKAMLKFNNPFQLKMPNGKIRKFDSVDECVARYVLAIVDYDITKQSYTDYLESKPKAGWSPNMSRKLKEIYRSLYGVEYDYKHQLHTFKNTEALLRFAKSDSLVGAKKIKPYDDKFGILRRDKDLVLTDGHLGLLESLASKVDTQLVFLQVLWATDHFNPKSIKDNNIFQIVDESGRLMKYETMMDAIADYLVLIIDYDKKQESYLRYLERRTNGQWTRSMSDKMRKLYRALYRKDYDERGLNGPKQKNKENVRGSSLRSRNVL